MQTDSPPPRYAIYFVPAAEQPLFQFGRAVLGYDCYTGEEPARLTIDGLAADELAALTREPRAYGFHATLKAPFRLLPGWDETNLIQALAAFSAEPTAIPLIEPSVRGLGPFIAVMARRPCAAIDKLAARCVSAFDRFRAPLTDQERQRRLAGGLDATAIARLDRWGYPFVFEAFRFHMTLASPVPPGRRSSVAAALQAAFAKHCGEAPIAVDRLALLRQDDARACFRVVAHNALTV